MGIKEVAKLAGVSPSTVSRVVNGNMASAASPETQKRIWSAVRELQYTPNPNAQKLKLPNKENLILKREIDCIYARVSGNHIDSFFTTLMHAAEIEAFSRGYSIRYFYSAIDIQKGVLPRKNKEVDSVIILGRIDKQTMDVVRSIYKNIICTGLNESVDGVDVVISSGYDAAVKCVQYLASIGHRKICYLGETENEQRFTGYLDAMKKLYTSVDTGYIVETPFTPGGGYHAINELMARNIDFTAIFCANDMSVVGCLKALREHSLNVPDDVSIIAINDMETVRYLDPMITSMHIPLEEMGKAVAKVLIDRIEGGHKLPIKITIPSHLVLRESCSSLSPLL